MLSSVRAITRRAIIFAAAGVLALSTIPAAAADTLEELMALNERAWSGETELLAEVYGPDGVHSATFYDRTNVYTGPDEIKRVIIGTRAPTAIGPRVQIPAADGEYRWVDFYAMGGGTACLWHVADGQIARHDCLLSENSASARPGAPEADGSTSAAIDEVMERLDAAWGPGSTIEALEAVYAPDAVHSARYLNGTRTYEGPAEIRWVSSGSSDITQIGPRMEFEAPEGELAWAEVADVGGGTVCIFRAVDGLITRHDCVLPISW